MKRLTIQLTTIITALGMTGSVLAAELLNLTTTDKGLHRISYDELVAKGADLAGLQHTRFGLTLNGDPVQIRSKGQSNGSRRLFGEGGYIEFYAEKADSLYSEKQVFTLHLLERGERHLRKRFLRDRTSVDRTAPAAEQYQHTTLVEENNTYDFAAPSATNPFHFGQTFSLFATPTYSFELENSGLASLEVEMYGLLDFDIEGNDHEYEVLVNGQLAGGQQFDGATATTLDLQNVAINSGANTFKYNYVPIAGVPFDRITLNKFTVAYPRTTEASDNYLEGYFDTQQAVVSNLDSKGNVYRKLSSGEIVILSGVKLQGSNTLFATGGQAGEYIVVADSGFKEAQVEAIAEQQDITSGTAEYIIIAHPSLMGSELDELVQLRSAEYLVKVVDVNQIYAQFGNHNADDRGIREYVKHAVTNMGARMFTIVGNDTLDYKQFISSSVSLVPTSYVTTPGGALTITQTPSDASYGDVDNDGVPDYPFGRISARTTQELGFVIDKIKEYEARSGYVARTVIATDKDDLGNGVSFSDDADAMIAAIPEEWSDGIRDDFLAYPDVDGHQEAHDKLINLINVGASVVSYIGHSSQQSWAFTTPPMLRATEIAGLANQGKPTLVTQWGCWNTYYVDPNGNTMADSFLLSENIGAATVLGASTLTSSSGERALGIELNRRMYTEGLTIGEALIQAKKALAQYADFPAVQLGWQALGDVAIKVNH